MISNGKLLILLFFTIVAGNACKMKKIKSPMSSGSSSAFYLSPIEQLDRLVNLNPEAPDPNLLRGVEGDLLNPFIKPEFVHNNEYNKVPSLARATSYLKSDVRGGLNAYKIKQVQKRLWTELNPIAILKVKVIDLIKSRGLDLDDSYSHFVLTRLGEDQSVKPKDIKSLLKRVHAIQDLDDFEKLLSDQYKIPESYKVDFANRFDVGDFNPEDILRNHGFRADDPSPAYKPLKKSLRDELLRYSKELSYEQKAALYQSLQERINTDNNLAFLRGQILRKETARKIPFHVLMETMVENRSVFGPYIIKKIQQEYSRINSMQIALDDNVQGFMKKSQARNLSQQESDDFLQKARKLIPGVLGEGSKVLQAGSLGIVFENHEGKIVKWVPDEVIKSLLDDKAKYIEVIRNIDAGQDIDYPRDVIDAGLQDEYRRRLRDEWKIKVDEINEFIAETDLNIEVKNGEDLGNYNTVFRKNNEFIGEISIVAGKTLDQSSVSDDILDPEKRVKIASQFNIQDKASGYDLKWFNDPKNHSLISPSQRIQIQNSLQKLMNVHIQSMFSGNYFHGDLHEGNIRIELHQDGSTVEVKKISIIDLGTVGYLDLIERQALKGIFDLNIAQKLVTDSNLIDKILYYNYSKLSDKQRDVLAARDNFNFSQPQGYQEAKIKEIDSKIKYYMTGLSKDGFNLGIDGFKLKEYKTFLGIFAGKSIPDDSALRLLGLRPNVVALFKATSTAAGVVNASNARAGNYISTGEKPRQIAQKSIAEFMEYLGKINAYSLKRYQAELLTDIHQLDRSRSGIPEEMIDYIKQRRMRGVELEDIGSPSVWRDILNVEVERAAMQSELKDVMIERQALSDQLESARQKYLEETTSKDIYAKKLEELNKQLTVKDKVYQDSLLSLKSKHDSYVDELKDEIGKLEAKKLASAQDLSNLRNYLAKMEKEHADYEKTQVEYANLQETSRNMQQKLDELSDLSEKQVLLEQTNKDLQANNEALKAKQQELISLHEQKFADLNSKMAADLASRDEKIKMLQEKQRNLSDSIQKYDEMIAKSNAFSESQVRQSDKLSKELAKTNLALRRLLLIEIENTQLRKNMSEIKEIKEKNRLLSDLVSDLQSKNSQLVQDIASKDSEISKLLYKQELLQIELNRLNTELSRSISQEEKSLLTEQVKTKELEIDDLNTELSNRPTSSEVQSLREGLLANQEKVKSLNGQIVQLSQVQEQLAVEKRVSTQIRGELEMKKQEATQIKEELEIKQKRLEQLSSEFNTRDIESNNKIKELKEELDTSREQIAQMEQTNTENIKLREQIDTSEREISTISKQLQKLQGEYQQSLQAAEAELDKIKQELANKSASEAQLKKRASEIEQQMELSKKAFTTREKSLKIAKQNLESQLKDLNNKLKLANNENQALRKKIMELQAKIYESEQATRELNDIESKLNEAGKRITLLEDQDHQLRNGIERLEHERDRLQTRNNELIEQLEAANSDLESLKQAQTNSSTWEEMRTRLEQSEARNKELAKELAESRVKYLEPFQEIEAPNTKTTLESPQFTPQRSKSVFSSTRYTSPVINVNKYRIYNSKIKGLGALYFGIGASLISGGAILINEGVKEATPGN